jgi:ABC-type phosphate/phosphonate transport system substrate-binding protein
VAINEPASWSGHRALRRHVVPKWFADEMISGAHVASIDAVCSSAADCSAIDHSIWDYERALPGSAANQLVVIDQTRDWPAPPFVLSRAVDAETVALVTSALLGAGPVPGVHSVRAADAERYGVMAPSPEQEEDLL